MHDLIQKTHNLTDLNVTATKGVDDELLYSLSKHCSKLRNVNFKGCKEVTEKKIATLFFRFYVPKVL